MPDLPTGTVTFLPAALHDMTPVHALTYGLPTGARVFGDTAFNSNGDEATILAERNVLFWLLATSAARISTDCRRH